MTASRIPARIIQTGKDGNLPLMAKAAVVNVKLLNSQFEYLFFRDLDVTAFVQKEFPEYREVFEALPFRIQRYDFFRYLAVYRLGGFYLDLDVFLAMGLEELRPLDCVFPFEQLTLNRYLRRTYGMDWELGNYGFGASPGHPFLRAVIQNCVKAQQDPLWVRPMMKGIPRLFRSEFHVLNTTGPGLLARTFAENPQLARSVTVLFPEDVCDTGSWHKFGNLGVHMMDGSWRGAGFLRRRLRNLWETWTSRRVLAQVRRRGKTRVPMRALPATARMQG
jgi:hypothetical protein